MEKKVADIEQLAKGKHSVLLNEIEAFCESIGIAESTFGRLAVNDGKFVNRIRSGSKIGDKMVARVQGFMSEVNSGTRRIEGRDRRRVGVAKKKCWQK